MREGGRFSIQRRQCIREKLRCRDAPLAQGMMERHMLAFSRRDRPLQACPYAAAGFGCREIASTVSAAMMQSAPAAKKAGR